MSTSPKDFNKYKDVKLTEALVIALTMVDTEMHLTDDELNHYKDLNWIGFIADSIKEDVKIGRSLDAMFQESLDLLERITKFE